MFKRITGTVGEDNLEVRTEWMENPVDGELAGMKMAFEKLRGWNNVEIEEMRASTPEEASRKALDDES